MSEVDPINRRRFLFDLLRGAAAASLAGGAGALVMFPPQGNAEDCVRPIDCSQCVAASDCTLPKSWLARGEEQVWQIDPLKCTQCGKCATDCVLNPSAVKCLNSYQLCGYCNLCTGYFEASPNALNTGAENQLCPTGALKRQWVEGEYFEYDVAAQECIGCAKCVKGCGDFGNGSLFLQIDRKLCVNCNQCSIARVCPAQAISRVPAKQAYQLKMTFRNG